ncbi:MAG: VOC family protein [Arthrobacter sp.]|uniref:VOC family protein n=1 Tax=unclassified Arthrobacter TaxID=235627 RepID=UPI002651F621|nr:VOC family protein [Micrococcaceae bacterium]MDN5812679.1 VOC family protein [Micrococcaceae bacterium]MDN5825005.1 VOC family protein [Micrococcaceae bacterium]MDN5879369.1 VOC family protein [Micrococcaceae bacterium]MDN5887678.1 VOC family protein [Micrococcaceae bacterium]
MTGEISFIEFGAGDAAESARFYAALFGWRSEPGPNGPDAGYQLDVAGTPGGLHSGDPGAAPYVFFAVEQMQAACDRVVELGGTVDPMDLNGDAGYRATHGLFTLCRDQQGSPFGLHQRPAG